MLGVIRDEAEEAHRRHAGVLVYARDIKSPDFLHDRVGLGCAGPTDK